jgi:hypothetical protein
VKVASFADLERDWSVEDVVMMNGILDALDQAEGDARREAEKAHRAATAPAGRR